MVEDAVRFCTFVVLPVPAAATREMQRENLLFGGTELRSTWGIHVAFVRDRCVGRCELVARFATGGGAVGWLSDGRRAAQGRRQRRHGGTGSANVRRQAGLLGNLDRGQSD